MIEAASQFWATARNYAGASFSMMQTPNSRHADCGPGSTPYAFAIVGLLGAVFIALVPRSPAEAVRQTPAEAVTE